MISGAVPFEEIVQSVKDETGIENMRPLYEKIKRFIFRAEREIGYGGSVILKKKVYVNPGKYFSFPEDFIELEGVGKDCKPMCGSQYTPATEGVRFKCTQTDKIVLLYWGLGISEEGNPIVTRNHEEAVIAYIVWKLYKSRIFLGIGNMNANKDYENTFIQHLLEARGDDAFPTIEQWNELTRLSVAPRQGLLDYPVAGYEYCTDMIPEVCSETKEDDSGSETEVLSGVYYWQLDNLVDSIASVIDLLSEEYFEDKQNKAYSEFAAGTSIEYVLMGRICFAIANASEEVIYQIFNELNIDITDQFETYYDETLKIKLFVTQNFYSYSNIYFKFKTL